MVRGPGLGRESLHGDGDWSMGGGPKVNRSTFEQVQVIVT